MNKSELSNEISRVYVLSGYGIPDDGILIQVVDFVSNTIGDKFSHEEILYVFNSGLKKKYGEYIGLSAVLLVDWFEKFQKSDEREKLFPKLKLTEKTKPTAEEQYEMSKQYVIDAFNEYKSKMRYTDNFNVCYNFLDTYGHIDLTVELKLKYMDDAADIIRSRASLDKVERRINDIKFVEILEKLQSGTLNEQAVIAKKIALEAFFKGLVETDTDITEIFNS